MRLLTTWLTVDSTKALEIASPAIIWDPRAIGPNVAAELSDHLEQLLLLDARLLGVVEVDLKIVDRLQRTEDVAMPEEPLQPGQLLQRLGGQFRMLARTEALDHLAHDRQPHRDVKPIDEMLGPRVQVERQVAYVLPAVRQEGDLLVHLHALGLQHLEQASLGLGVVRLNEAKAPGRPVGRHALASDDFEPAVSS